MRYQQTNWRSSLARAVVCAATVLSTFGATACKGLLDVKNPNNIAEESLNNPQAAAQQANGVEASTTRMLSAVSVPYGVATDELDWIGSRDAWLNLEKGAISNYLNEFTDGAFPYVGEARYLGDQTVKRLEAFNASNALTSKESLARTYLYTAITYATIADMWDDFAFSSKTTPAPAVGRANMVKLYDTAIGYLDKALPLAGTDVDMQYAITAWRARVKQGKAIWQKITPEGQTPANPLVNDAGANTDARAALAVKPGGDDEFRLTSNVEAQPGINIWFEVNGRNESKIGTAFTTLNDPITGTRDPVSAAIAAEFKAFGSQDGVFTMTSDREMHLILAEGALATSDLVTFQTEINAVRALDALPDWTPASTVTASAILQHERMANLMLMRRRLADLYRFGKKVKEWATDPNFKSAVNTPGLLFPIPNIERLANPCIANASACGQ
jgi:starch-binding outer membrane protein, SusD/RagB family